MTVLSELLNGKKGFDWWLAQTGFQAENNFLVRCLASAISKRFLIFTGFSGSGKTRIAQALATFFTDSHSQKSLVVTLCSGVVIKADRASYEILGTDRYSVRIRSLKVENGDFTVSRQVLQEWIRFLHDNPDKNSASSLELKEAIQKRSAFSASEHFQHTPLKTIANYVVEKEAVTDEKPIKAPCQLTIPVGADWTSNENILGYPDGLDKGVYVSTPSLDLILRAGENPDVPYFLILDEMNLSHVERYFADMLSAIESGEAIPLYEGPERKAGDRTIPNRLSLPKNLFVIGTVNVDETTYLFSPKVLDRAQVIEFRVSDAEMGRFLAKPDGVDLSRLAGKGEAFAKAFCEEAAKNDITVPEAAKVRFEPEMLTFFKLFQQHDAEFGFRIAREAATFIHFHNLLSGLPADDEAWFNEAFDAVILQKMLPKLNGSRTKLEGLLWALAWACGSDRQGVAVADFREQIKTAGHMDDEAVYGPEAVEKKYGATARYPLSFAKVMRLWRRLVRDQFASFSEA